MAVQPSAPHKRLGVTVYNLMIYEPDVLLFAPEKANY